MELRKVRKPSMRSLAGPSSAKRVVSSCLLCCRPCKGLGACAGASCADKAYPEIPGAEGVEPLEKELVQWFVLRKVLDLPTDWCESKWTSEGDGDKLTGFRICEECLRTVVFTLWQIHQQILLLKGRMEEIKAGVRRNMKQNAARAGNVGNGITTEIRELVLPELSDILLERELRQLKSEGAEEVLPSDIEMNSGDDWQPAGDWEGDADGGDVMPLGGDWVRSEKKPKTKRVVKRKKVAGEEGRLKRKRKWKKNRPRLTHPCSECCVVPFWDVQDLERHQQLHQERKLNPGVDEAGRNLDCPQCSYPAVDHQELLFHIKTRHDKFRTFYECPAREEGCSKAPDRWEHIIKHVETIHDEQVKRELVQRYLLCDQCSFEARTPYYLRIHRRREHAVKEPEPEEVLKCPECEVLCATTRELKMHVTNEHRKVNRFVCTTCGKGFLYQSYLAVHESSHRQKEEAPQRDWICEACGVDFATRKTLDTHWRRCHSEEAQAKKAKEFKCRLCDFRSTFRMVVRRHREQAHKQDMANRAWHCDVCDKIFTLKQGLRLHQKRFHGSNAEGDKCPHCRRTFKTEGQLRVHVRGCRVKELTGAGEVAAVNKQKVQMEQQQVEATLYEMLN